MWGISIKFGGLKEWHGGVVNGHAPHTFDVADVCLHLGAMPLVPHLHICSNTITLWKILIK